MYPPLNFPPANLRFRRNSAGNPEVYDFVRKKFVALSPEEWVRQHCIHYLVKHLGYPSGLLAVEKSILLNNTQKRMDILAFDNQKNPLLLVECKAPDIELNQEVLNQIQRYHLVQSAKAILITNGLINSCFILNQEGFSAYPGLPDYETLLTL